MQHYLPAGSEWSVDFIWAWYDLQKKALDYFKTQILSRGITDDEFSYLSLQEVDIRFDSYARELEHLACLDLATVSERMLRLDFNARSKNRKSVLDRAFSVLHQQSGNRIRLEDILELWKKHFPRNSSTLSDYLGLINYRNWLAHGRYLTPKIGRAYPVDVTFDIVDKIFRLVESA